MLRSSAFRALAAAGVALLLVAGGASAAVADQIIVDGDGVVPIAGPDGQAANIGAACTDTSRTFTVLLAARGNGGDQNRFADGAVVTVSFTSAEQGMTASMPDTTLTVDGDWHVDTQNRIGTDTIAVPVTLPAKTAAGQGKVNFAYSGAKTGSTTQKVEGNASVTVNWTAGVTCVSVTDTIAPVLTLPADLTAEATSAAGAVVTFEATATDETAPAEPLVTCQPRSGTTFPLGTTTVSCTAKDAAGNEGTGTFDVVVEDTTAPVVEDLPDVVREATGPTTVVAWASPTVTEAVTSGLVAACSPESGTGFEVGVTTVTCSATDAAGNTGSSTFTVEITDTTPPVITWTAGPVNGGHYVFGEAIPQPSCTAVDLVDGDVDCLVDGFSTVVGTHELTATAADSRGNVSTTEPGAYTYTVDPWTTRGFFQPVDMGGVLNTVKAGSTVPLKFEVFAGATELTNVTAVKSFTVKAIACSSASTLTDDIELVSTGSTVLRYDTTAGQFIQNWQTPKSGAGNCYRVTMLAADNVTTITADFKLK
ncbi:HYR domain-containing protein [Microbacterium sp. LWH7-1.2]|uniref:PxKF domain-containing protein n=1 Tax=Microbacterium sp. LWH7-1.2 TaxID=3135257 RepID=UPI00313A0614